MEGPSTEKEREEYQGFNPNAHLIQLKNRQGSADYLPVQWRLVWFREQCPGGSIKTTMLHLDLDRETEDEAYQWNTETRRSEKIIKRANGIAVFHAEIEDGKGGFASGTKSERAASFPDFIEKAETGAIGRALAALGYGTQFTGDEFDEKHRIVDAPVDRGDAGENTATSSSVSTSRPTTTSTSKPATTTPQQPKQASKSTTQPQSLQAPATTPVPTPVVEEPGVELTEEVEALLARYMKLGKHERRAFLQQQSMDPELDLRRGFEWNPESYALFRGRLDEWVTSPERKEWCAGQITDAQLHEITAAQDPASIVSRFKGLFGTLKEAQAQLFVIRDLDDKMHGKSFREFSAGLADRFIYYVEQGRKEPLSPHYTVTIPEKYRYKEPGTTTEQEQQKGAA